MLIIEGLVSEGIFNDMLEYLGSEDIVHLVAVIRASQAEEEQEDTKIHSRDTTTSKETILSQIEQRYCLLHGNRLEILSDETIRKLRKTRGYQNLMDPERGYDSEDEDSVVLGWKALEKKGVCRACWKPCYACGMLTDEKDDFCEMCDQTLCFLCYGDDDLESKHLEFEVTMHKGCGMVGCKEKVCLASGEYFHCENISFHHYDFYGCHRHEYGRSFRCPKCARYTGTVFQDSFCRPTNLPSHATAKGDLIGVHIRQLRGDLKNLLSSHPTNKAE